MINNCDDNYRLTKLQKTNIYFKMCVHLQANSYSERGVEPIAETKRRFKQVLSLFITIKLGFARGFTCISVFGNYARVLDVLAIKVPPFPLYSFLGSLPQEKKVEPLGIRSLSCLSVCYDHLFAIAIDCCRTFCVCVCVFL